MSSLRPLVLGIAATTLIVAPAWAWPHHHRSAIRSGHPSSAAAAAAYAPIGYPAGGWQAAVMKRDAARMQAAPGDSSELAPGVHESATGGPSGGMSSLVGGG